MSSVINRKNIVKSDKLLRLKVEDLFKIFVEGRKNDSSLKINLPS